LEPTNLLAHAGHAVYDHPAMAVIMALALIVPWIVLFLVGRWFVRAAREEEEQQQPRG
jgi:Sec-independent protein secretion pathway component TatC